MSQIQPSQFLLAVSMIVVCSTLTLGVRGEQLLYNGTGTIYPTLLYQIPFQMPLNQSTALRIVVEAIPCNAEGTECSPEFTSLAETHLYCKTVDSADGYDFISALPGRREEIIISPLSGQAYAASDSESIKCEARIENFVPTPLQLTINVTGDFNITAMVQPEQDAAKAIFDTCCSTPGACAAWDQATEAAGMKFEEGEVFTDMCNIDNNICDAEGHLVGLNLDDYLLSCDMAAMNFSAFTKLEYLNLARNNLTGDFTTVAQQLAVQIPALAMVDVGGNTALTGKVGTEGGAGGLCDLAGLEYLGIYRTQIGGELPACLVGEKGTLRELQGRESQVDGPLPPELAKSTSITILDLSLTKIIGEIPTPLPASLVSLNLSENALTASVPDLSAAKFLTIMDLSNNDLTGPVTGSAANHPSLRFLDLTENNLFGLPEEWTNAAATPEGAAPLQVLLLGQNPLKTPFPVALQRYPNLTFLNLNDAGLEGRLPEVEENGFPWLEQIFVNNNNLTGPIPESWRNSWLFSTEIEFGLFRVFSVANNSLDGDIPAFLGDSPFISVIDLTGNNFTNACDEQFDDLEKRGSLEECSSEDGNNDGESGGGGGGGLSAWAVAVIVIISLGMAAGAGLLIWRRYQRHGGDGNGKFTRFDEDSGLQLGQTGPAGRSSANVYNAQLAP